MEQTMEEQTMKKVPESVAILGLGPSLHSFLDLAKGMGGRNAIVEEVWGINSVGNVLACDLIFHMDDVLIQESRAELNPNGNIKNMLDWLKTTNIPVYTSIKRDGYPSMMEFPLEEVLNTGIGHCYFNSTVAYAVAYAIFIGVKKIHLYGIDFSYGDARYSEKGRGCVEFWLGVATSRGIKVCVAANSTLLDACVPPDQFIYGYDAVDVGFGTTEDGSRLALKIEPREKIPSAEEIEKRYDHSLKDETKKS